MIDDARAATLVRAIRGKSFRRALKAIRELRAGGAATDLALGRRPPDDQRAAQLEIARIVLAGGVRGLVSAWPVPEDPQWRAELVSEIGQYLDSSAEEDLADLVLAALEDVDRGVRVKAAWALQGILKEPMSGARGSRATRAILAMIAEHRRTPLPVLAQLVEALGYTATKDDREAIDALESLRDLAGEPHRVIYEKLDATTLDWRDRLLAEQKGIAPDRLKLRIHYQPTGLFDEKRLDAALRRIRGDPPTPRRPSRG